VKTVLQLAICFSLFHSYQLENAMHYISTVLAVGLPNFFAVLKAFVQHSVLNGNIK
jgi:hypothetical protein